LAQCGTAVASRDRVPNSNPDSAEDGQVKPEGLVSGANALRYWQARQQVVANNLANAETYGFKGERVFARLLGDMVQPEAATDFSQGALTPTERPLDLAIEGEGFFVVDTPAGERLTRGGSLRMDEAGRIVDGAGNTLLGENGRPLIVPEGKGEIAIGTGGRVLVDGREIGTLRVERASEGTQLFHEGAALFRAEGATEPIDPAERRVRQGHVEASNVGTLETMVDMINIQRAYAAVHNSLQVQDGVLDTVANQIGRLS
jgi:flagellar basal-body rod protein FlgF